MLDVRGHRVLQRDDVLLGLALRPHPLVNQRLAIVDVRREQQVVGRTPGEQYPVIVLAHREQPAVRSLRAAHVVVRQFRHGVTDAVVDGPADFAAFDVHDANVHQGGGGREGQRVETVAVDDEQIRLQSEKDVRQFDHGHTDRFHHRGLVFTSYNGVQAAVDGQAVVLNQTVGGTVER